MQKHWMCQWWSRSRKSRFMFLNNARHPHSSEKEKKNPHANKEFRSPTVKHKTKRRWTRKREETRASEKLCLCTWNIRGEPATIRNRVARFWLHLIRRFRHRQVHCQAEIASANGMRSESRRAAVPFFMSTFPSDGRSPRRENRRQRVAVTMTPASVFLEAITMLPTRLIAMTTDFRYSRHVRAWFCLSRRTMCACTRERMSAAFQRTKSRWISSRQNASSHPHLSW